MITDKKIAAWFRGVRGFFRRRPAAVIVEAPAWQPSESLPYQSRNGRVVIYAELVDNVVWLRLNAPSRGPVQCPLPLQLGDTWRATRAGGDRMRVKCVQDLVARPLGVGRSVRLTVELENEWIESFDVSSVLFYRWFRVRPLLNIED